MSEEPKSELFNEIETELATIKNTLHSEIDGLEQFRYWINELYDIDWGTRSDDIAPFYEVLESEIGALDQSSGTEDYLSSYDRLETAYRDPVLDAAISEIDQILNELNDPLEKNEKTEIFEDVRSLHESSPEEFRNKITEISDSVNGSSNAARNIISEKIESDPRIILDPSKFQSEIVDRAIEFTDKYNSLNATLREVLWIPDEIIPIYPTEEAYRKNLDIEEIDNKVDEINQLLNDLSKVRVPLNSAIENSITERFEDGGEIEEVLSQDILFHLEYINDCKTQIGIVENIDETADEFDEFDPPRYLLEFRSLEDDIDLETLRSKIGQICDGLSNWFTEANSEWNEIRRIIPIYVEQFGAELPTRIESHLDEPLSFEENPEESIEILIEGRNWILDQSEAGLEGLQSETAQLLEELLSDGQAELTDDRIDSVQELVDMLPLKVIIDE